MINHTVVFRLIHLPGSQAEKDFLETAGRELASIPGVEGFAVHRQVSPKSDAAWQFSMHFASQQVYDSYNDHPAHTAFVEGRWVPEVASFQEYDFIER